MKRKYVFFTPAIGNIGGTQLFVRNKAAYLRSVGWDVSVIYFQYFDILIEELKEYESGYISDLRYGVQYMTASLRTKVVNEITQKIGSYEEVIIESHMFRLAYWAELVARAMKCIHVLAPLEEERPKYCKFFFDFLDFKIKRHECLNASEDALKRFLGPYYNVSYNQYIHQIDAYCSNVVDNSSKSTTIFEKADYSIMSVGRLEKPYIIPMFEEIKAFVASKKDKSINVLVVGASPEGDKEKIIKHLFNSIKNVRLYFLGFLYPIPSSYLDIVDVGIACANSILVTSEYGIPTIAVDWQDYDAIGIYGETTTNMFHRTNEPRIKISALLNDTLNKNKTDRTKKNRNNVKLSDIFEDQLLFIGKANKKHEYYDVTKIFSMQEKLFCNVKRLVHEILKR